MCGRYALYGPKSRLTEHFGVEPEFWIDRFNIAPTQNAPVVSQSESGRATFDAKWGLIPSWVKDPGTISKPINAKLETAAEKPMFRTAFRRSRVIVPAAGFYEWRQEAGHKQPYFIRPADDGGFFGFGGLLEQRIGPDGEGWSFAILTTAANELMAPLHRRMPVIIRSEDYEVWLDPSVTDPLLVRAVCEPFSSDEMLAYPVGRAVGNPRAQGPTLVEAATVT